MDSTKYERTDMKNLLSLAMGMLSFGLAVSAQYQAPFVIHPNLSGGPALGYSPASGVKLIEHKGFFFKDLNRNGKLDKYEDWRLSADERAADLSRRMSIEQIAGLMLYSIHQSIPAGENGFLTGNYGGKPFSQSGAMAWDLTDEQKRFLEEDNLRHILIVGVESPRTAARWNNAMQAFVEGIGFGIPGNTSSDPRHAATADAEFNAGAGGVISRWPRELGMAATFDPELVRHFGEIASAEYRALGICTALSPQIDIASEPRWFRLGMTFGEGTQLVTDLARAYIDGFQTSLGRDEIKDGWGYQSVNAMVKHWPGGGTGEGGRDAHWAYGKFGVYPGNNFEEHLLPFTEGAFLLNGKTAQASAVMPYYTISHNRAPDGSNYGNGFSRHIVTDLLREKYGYDGVVCTDWLITGNEGATPGDFAGKPWGAESLTIAERHFLAIQAGVDQFGGNNEKGPVLEAYKRAQKEWGKAAARKRFEQSATRLLRNIFRLGLFENPYLDAEESARIVGNPDFMQAGYEAQVKSSVLLKNRDNVLPVRERKAVFIPKVYVPAAANWWGIWTEPKLEYPVSLDIVEKYYDVTTNPAEADFALVFVSNPHSEEGGYSRQDRLAGNNGYVPISLQYNPYTADEARRPSIAAGDPVVDPDVTDRSYLHKTSRTANATDLDILLQARRMMGGKPVVAVIDLSNPMVFHEFEPSVDAILLRFGSSMQSVLEILSGKYEPSGLLPVQMPADMAEVERQCEDVPRDMNPHVDTEGHRYDFGFGLNWHGVIRDERTSRYGAK
jgi:beta-glucosidase